MEREKGFERLLTVNTFPRRDARLPHKGSTRFGNAFAWQGTAGHHESYGGTAQRQPDGNGLELLGGVQRPQLAHSDDPVALRQLQALLVKEPRRSDQHFSPR
jgi:hypothetical protein